MREKKRALPILMALIMAFTMMPMMADQAFADGVKTEEHDPYKHAKVSHITQEYGSNTLYIQCEWEKCRFCEWPLMILDRPDAYYDGNPKEAGFQVMMMRDYPNGELTEEFPYDYAKWDGEFTYEGINGTVEYGPTTKAPIGEGTYCVYTTVTIPSAASTASSGKFVLKKTFTIIPSAYDVRFDANVPGSASTKNRLTGAMPEIHFNSSVDTRQLPPNQYSLPGYAFDRWNTKPDGTGTRYENNAMVKALSNSSRDVTLFAQWVPKQYTITYGPGSAGGNQVKETALFDQPVKLKTIADMGWTVDTRGFLGWSVEDHGLILSDQEEFVNLGGEPEGYYNDPGDAVLEAQWAEPWQITAAVTKDGVPQSGLADSFRLISNGTDVSIDKTYEDGRYVFDTSHAELPGGGSGALPFGEYELVFEAEDSTASSMNFAYDGAAAVSAIFDCWTVSLKADPADKAVHEVEMTGEDPDLSITEDEGRYTTSAQKGEQLKLKTTVAPGYHFDGYSVIGTAPEWEDSDPMKEEQTVAVKGRAEIMAHAAPNTYKVHYDANTEAPIIGKMKDQDMVYGEPQNLSANEFARSWARFTGWNTEADGTGKTYKDKESVKDLTAENGGSVTLYAQWEKITPKPDPKPTQVKVSGTLLAKITAKGKNSLVLTWNKVKGAEGYDVFFVKCSKKKLKKVKTIKGNKTFKWIKKSLKTKKAYKAVVKAYVTKNGKKTYVRTSPMVHAYTSGSTKNYTNAKSVTVKKTSVSLKTGKKYKIKADVIKLRKGKKLMLRGHAPKLRYVSSNKKIATVSKSGKITARKKGSCKVYVIAVNGARKTIKVTVK